MKKKILILGYRSFLSQALKKSLTSSILIKSKEIVSFDKKLSEKKKYIVIINLFYPTYLIKNYNKKKFEYFSEKLVFKFLNKLVNFKISKIIYTSSSIVNYPTLKRSSPRYHYQRQKKKMEKKIFNYCKRKDIPCTIVRPYNIYGEGDRFSIIRKLIDLKKRKIKKLEITNQGLSIRDYINIKDIVRIYNKIINSNISGFFSLGTGVGIKLIELIKLLNLQEKIIFMPKGVHEVRRSTCNTLKLKKIIDIKSFIDIRNYLKIKKKKI